MCASFLSCRAIDDDGNEVEGTEFVVGDTDRIDLVFEYTNLGPDGAPRPSITFELTGVASTVIDTVTVSTWLREGVSGCRQ